MVDKVLIAYGSKYGATQEIAEKIGEVLKQAGLQADVIPGGKAGDPAGYGAVVLGSSVYIGAWRKEISGFIKKYAAALAQRPVWIFSSGPTGPGDPMGMMKGWIYPRALKAVIEGIKPRNIIVFSGATREARWNLLEKFAMKQVKAPMGDYRDWAAITAWANSIAAELKK